MRMRGSNYRAISAVDGRSESADRKRGDRLALVASWIRRLDWILLRTDREVVPRKSRRCTSNGRARSAVALRRGFCERLRASFTDSLGVRAFIASGGVTDSEQPAASRRLYRTERRDVNATDGLAAERR